MRNLDDLPFIGTLANLLQAVHDPVGGRAQSFISREAGSLIPAGVANIAETIDPTVGRPQTALQAIESRIPGLTSAAPPIVDITGQTEQRPQVIWAELIPSHEPRPSMIPSLMNSPGRVPLMHTAMGCLGTQ